MSRRTPAGGRRSPQGRPRPRPSGVPAAGTMRTTGPRGAAGRGWATRAAAPAPHEATALRPRPTTPPHPSPAAPVAPAVSRPAAAAGEPQVRRSRRVLVGSVVALVAVVAVVVAGGVWLVSSLLPSDTSPVTDVPVAQGQSSSASPSVEAAAPSVTDPSCPSRDVGSVSWGRGNGDTSSAVQTIKGFNYAYYVTRSGVAARDYVAPNALFGSAPQLQQAIDSLPAGTTHCLQITDQGGGTYAVTVAEFRPGAPRPVINAEVLTTADVGGRTLITGIPKNETVQK